MCLGTVYPASRLAIGGKMAHNKRKKEGIAMQAYRARYERGRVVTLDDPDIPEGSSLIVTVLDDAAPDNALLRQQRAVNEFLENMRNCDEPLGSEFDKVMGQRFNISRGLDL